ncbi:SDR family NAD(P)-dependent oxidoreductase [Myxococcus landrumensis]|uniref:SDR family NAD(P)-dependent oxidoreductase n=1 Tax=Myxococcus landrumensis TaxID=2813577 RepID=A0ABX7N0K1_9BACT|nr:SDR family NAD(P)-dependent oxidoreductase [Myxococcus landrumus]QSQ12230.1 SDR family NAD(P)-dependent oxidoreductase [Myxococcus landrumus]
MSRGWKNRVVVITGASNDTGRATARALARKGVQLVLASRREAPLGDLVRECESLGVRAIPVHLEGDGAESMQALAWEAVRAFGHFDAWINNAGDYLTGSLEETPDDAFRQLLETHFLGTVQGTRAAVAWFRRQGYGTLVNVSSSFAGGTAPFVSAYAASRHAVRGFTASVRQELLDTGIHVCTVMPAAVDAPLWHHTANYTDWRLRPEEPVHAPERVARVILRVLREPRAEVQVGLPLRTWGGMAGLLPRTWWGAARARHSTGERLTPTAGVYGDVSSRRKWPLRRLLVVGGVMATAAFLRGKRARERFSARIVHALGV